MRDRSGIFGVECSFFCSLFSKYSGIRKNVLHETTQSLIDNETTTLEVKSSIRTRAFANMAEVEHNHGQRWASVNSPPFDKHALPNLLASTSRELYMFIIRYMIQISDLLNRPTRNGTLHAWMPGSSLLFVIVALESIQWISFKSYLFKIASVRKVW